MEKKTPNLFFIFCYLVIGILPPAFSQNLEIQLVNAIEEEDHSKVDSLLKVGANPNFQQSNISPTLCMLAVYHSDLSMLKILLKYGANCKQKGVLKLKRTFEEYNFGSILHIAAAEGKTSIVNYVIDSLGISIDLLDNSVSKIPPITPLYLACKSGKNRTIIELLNRKANTKLDFESPLFALLKNQTINENLKDQILAEIFSSFDYKKLVDNEGKTVFHYLDFQFLFIEKLFNTGTHFSEVQDYSGNTALHYIVQKENYLLAQKLINDGFDVDIRNNKNKTALDYIDNLKIKSRLGIIEEDTLKYECWKYLTKRALFEVYNKKEENYLSLLKVAKEKINFNNIDDSYLYYSTVDQINILMDDHENIPISNSKVDSLFILNPNLSLFNRIQYYKNKSICEYFCLNRLDQADSLLNLSKNKLFLLNGSFSEEMAEILDLESSYKVGYSRFNEAQKLLQDVEIILNELQSELYFLLSPSAYNQAQVLVLNENYEFANVKIEKALNAVKKQSSRSLKYRYFQFLELNGQTYYFEGNLKKCNENYIHLIEEFPKLFKENDYSFPVYLTNYGSILYSTGNMADGEKYLLKAIETQTKIDSKSENLAGIYTFLADLYNSIEDYERANEVYSKIDTTLDLYSTSVERHLIFNKFKLNIGNKKISDSLFSIVNIKYGGKRVVYDFLRYKSMYEFSLGNFSFADSLINIVIDGYKTLGQTNTDFFQVVLLKSQILRILEKYNDAERIILELENQLDFLTMTEEMEVDLNIEKLNISRELKKYEQFDHLINKILDNLPLAYANATYSLTHGQTINFLNSKKDQNSYIQSLLYLKDYLKPQTLKKLYEIIGMLKLYALSNFELASNKIRESKDEETKKKYKKLKNAYHLKNDPKLDEKTKKINEEIWYNLYKEILWNSLKASSSFQVGEKKSIQLKKEELYIEFTNFNKMDQSGPTDEMVYFGIIQEKDTTIAIPLFEEKQIIELLKFTSGDNEKDINALFSKSNSLKLYNLIFKKMAPFLNNKKVLYVSPSGLLNRIPFHALVNNKYELLSEKFRLIQVFGSGSLKSTFSSDLKNIAIYGDIKYDSPYTSTLEQSESTITYSNVPNLKNRGEKWGELKGSAFEVNKISQILKQKGYAVEKFTKNEATEESVKLIGTKEISPDILHFATHGFSFNKPSIPSSRKENFYTDNTLLTSGLLFAGGNNFWGRNNISLDKEDGILNALEISGLDFSNTKLVVMSACQTALGEIKGNEGVFGLQRAFKMAGVEYIIASLWKVPDTETAEIMILFYENLAKKESIEDAFRNAQLQMRKKYPPYYWAGFVLTR